MEHFALAEGLSGDGLDLKKVSVRRRRQVQLSVDTIKVEVAKMDLVGTNFEIWMSINLEEGRDALEGRMIQIGRLRGRPRYRRELPPTFNSTLLEMEISRLARFGAPYKWTAGDIISDGCDLLNDMDDAGLLDNLPAVPAGAVPGLRRVPRLAAVHVRARTPPISPRYYEVVGENSQPPSTRPRRPATTPDLVPPFEGASGYGEMPEHPGLQASMAGAAGQLVTTRKRKAAARKPSRSRPAADRMATRSCIGSPRKQIWSLSDAQLRGIDMARVGLMLLGRDATIAEDIYG